MTIATLLVSAFMMLSLSFRSSEADESKMPFRGAEIISTILTWNNLNGPARLDAALHPGGGPAKLHAGRATVCLRSITTGALRPFEFLLDRDLVRVEVASPLSVTGTEICQDAVLTGLGLAQMPVFHIERDLAEGRLVRILANFALPVAPVSVLYPRNRQLSPCVRLFIDWILEKFTATGAEPGTIAT
ncbi:LysR substrate-binding domain-containing protein [Pseudaminobacter soli (ex Zhang et al. 2022)]|uniref:LysR substrate-binding domain-containing protein n=1 Tax=Pseudaminobacter soli (ex Zhang et al. 2022) TaxID=2831468 RepID=UPI00308065FC